MNGRHAYHLRSNDKEIFYHSLCSCALRNAAIYTTAGTVTRYAGPARSIAIHSPERAIPIGPAKTDKLLTNPAFNAKDSPRPKIALHTALAIINESLY